MLHWIADNIAAADAIFHRILNIARKFDIPVFYRSPFVTAIKNHHKEQDTRKKDHAPTLLDFGPVRFRLARHFGFCYGVENAIEIAYRAVAEHPGKRIFLLSEMIHNPDVNRDLEDRGVRFIMRSSGEQIIPWIDLQPDDIVIVPAFGTTLEIQERLVEQGIAPYAFDTTCPFVERVWNKAAEIGRDDYTVVIHGKPAHEETRATFSHSKAHTPTVVVRDMAQARLLGSIILGEIPPREFYTIFEGQHSAGFNVATHLERIGVVNQTTMLAADTQAIADYLKQVMIRRYGLTEETWPRHFADTRDTLCYATNDNQSAVMAMLQEPSDLAIVAGGYNSSNTSHLVELCEEKLPTYYISSADKIESASRIVHFDFHRKTELTTSPFLPPQRPVTIAMTCGASCPDAIVEAILLKIVSFFDGARDLQAVRDEALAAI